MCVVKQREEEEEGRIKRGESLKQTKVSLMMCVWREREGGKNGI